MLASVSSASDSDPNRCGDAGSCCLFSFLSKQANLSESDSRGACLDFAALLPLLQTQRKLLCSAYLFFV